MQHTGRPASRLIDLAAQSVSPTCVWSRRSNWAPDTCCEDGRCRVPSSALPAWQMSCSALQARALERPCAASARDGACRGARVGEADVEGDPPVALGGAHDLFCGLLHARGQQVQLAHDPDAHAVPGNEVAVLHAGVCWATCCTAGQGPCSCLPHLGQATQLLLGQGHQLVHLLPAALEILHPKGKGADVGDAQLGAPLQRVHQLQAKARR